MSTRDPDSLKAFRKPVEKRKESNERAMRLRLFPNRYEEEILFSIGIACARLWNELCSLNIAHKLGCRIRIARKIESYLVTHSGVKLLNPHQELTLKTRQ
ncbi:MAG: hypothetical protein RQ885_05890 [Desulfurococcales archaeon]|nr:hypothetical protein [Desulfurococcales archaeon]